MGNYMNGGSSRGGAYGFSIETLLKVPNQNLGLDKRRPNGIIYS
jgi:hypothetical protein